MKVRELFEKEQSYHLDNKHLQGNLYSIKDKLQYGITLNGDFIVNNNELTSLEGMPENVIGLVNCSYNKLTDLKGSCLSVGRSFICKHNQIEHLKYGPKYVRGDFDISDNKLTDLKDVHKTLHTIKGKLILSNNPIRAHISDLLRIDGLQEVVFTGDAKAEKAFEMLNQYLMKTEEKKFSFFLKEDYNISSIEKFKSTLSSHGLEQFI